MQFHSSHGEILEKDGLILSLQHEFDHNQALMLQAKTLKHKLELEKAKAQKFVVHQKWNSHETKLKGTSGSIADV